jgi:hypothetical protein
MNESNMASRERPKWDCIVTRPAPRPGRALTVPTYVVGPSVFFSDFVVMPSNVRTSSVKTPSFHVLMAGML